MINFIDKFKLSSKYFNDQVKKIKYLKKEQVLDYQEHIHKYI